MGNKLNKIKILVNDRKDVDKLKLKEMFSDFLRNDLKGLHVENYIGDYPTFMEPVFLSENIKIGEDVLIGPNVYIGENSEIGDYVQLSNSIVFDNVKIGDNIKLENCIVTSNWWILYKNDSENNCVIDGRSFSKEYMKIFRINLE
jgi:NDP-sugar pyrophosphorylase family protein